MKKSCLVIGSGVAGLSAAVHLSHHGWDVTVAEKNDQPGGRARQIKKEGYTFDMGPSWYWMPDVFENFFNTYNKKVSDYYSLTRLDPSYKIFFEDNSEWDINADFKLLLQQFESIESGSADKLKKFLKDAEIKYKIGMQEMVYKPGNSMLELLDKRILLQIFKLNLFSSISSVIRNNFSDTKIRRLLEFPVLFLGAKPQNTPALYSLMNYADINLGTWYPEGGMYSVVKAMYQLAREKGVTFRFNSEVKKFSYHDRTISGAFINNGYETFDYVIAASDYHHVEQNILEQQFRTYSPAYWENKKLAPSSLIFYLGINKKLKGLQHHNLFFDKSFDVHAREIYDKPSWPSNPLFYVCAPGNTDATVAPGGCENLFILIPVAPGLQDTEEIKEEYFKKIIFRIEEKIKEKFKENIQVKISYAHSNFITDYYSYKGNAYGLANTLSQTAFLKPKIRSKKIKNLFYAGQLTVPGPGLPPSIISGQLAANEVLKTN
ncbi:MAG: phytoene desaturase family protein [Cytophagaceae bacterium]